MPDHEADDYLDVFEPTEIGRATFLCPVKACGCYLPDMPVLQCPCGLAHAMDRLCPQCGAVMVPVTVQ
jgi:hypothetical protein